jgi:hypothetical protein
MGLFDWFSGKAAPKATFTRLKGPVPSFKGMDHSEDRRALWKKLKFDVANMQPGEKFYFEYSASCDQHCCQLCRARDGKKFTANEALDLIVSPKVLCLSQEDHCRCCLLPYLEEHDG